jgi:hypothetical protein
MARLLFAVSLLLSLAAGLSAQEYGTIKGTFVFQGDAPEPKKQTVTKDAEVCGKVPQLAQDLIVAKDGGLANVVVYVIGDPKDANAPVKNIHPSYDKLKGTNVEFDNKACRFEPHVATMWTEQKLLLKNSDSVAHNSFVQPFANTAINPLIPAGGSFGASLPKPERVPVKVTCSIHPWMRGYVVVRPDPYVAVSTDKGEFKIENVPAGTHTLLLWQEALGYVRKADVGGKAINNARGQHAFTVKAGDNDLGKIVIKASDYTSQLSKLK